MIKKEIYLIILISILTIQLAHSQPIVKALYPYVDSIITISFCSTYIYEARLSQPLNPLEEICRIEIIDSTHDSIYPKPLPVRYDYFIDSVHGPIFYRFCGLDSVEICPFKIIAAISYPALLTNNLRLLEGSGRRAGFQTFSLYACSTYVTSTGDTLPCYTSSNIHLIRIAPHIWNLYFGLWYIDTIFSPKEPQSWFAISSFCNDSNECSEWLGCSALLPPSSSLWSEKPSFKFSYTPKNGTTFTDALPSGISIDLTLNGNNIFGDYYFFRLDSTSAWFIIRFETITGDTFIDTVRYGDPGTFWIVPLGKHIGWRRFGVMTMYTDIPSRGYTGVVEVCLMDVTNAPVIAFGEPTHLHPEGVSCYEDWVYVDSVTGDTTVIPDIIPAPPEPVCWRFGLISEVSEAERGEDKLNLEVVGGYLSPIQVFYKISGVGHLELYDITGKVVLRREITAKGSEKIAIDGLSSGVYFVRVVGGKNSIVRKIIVVK